MQKGVKHNKGKLPYYTVLFEQFPLAVKELIKCSQAGNNKYKETDEDWLNFTRVENAHKCYKEAGLRHLSEKGEIEDMREFGGQTHEAAVVWNFMADLEVNLRQKNIKTIEEVISENK